MADLATLGIDLDISSGQAKATQFGKTLEDMGAKGTAAANEVKSAGDKVTEMLGEQYASLREAQQAWIAQANAMGGFTQQQLLTQAELAKSSAAYEAMVTNMQAIEPAVASAGNSFNLAGAGVGRLRQGFISLIAQATGTIPVLDRTVGTLASMAAGSLVVTGVAGGLALVALGYDKLTESSRATAKAVGEAIDALEKQQHTKALGPGGEAVDQVQILQQQIAADSATIAQLQAQRQSPVALAGLMPGAGGMQMGLDERAQDIQKQIDRYKIAIGNATEQIQKIENEFILNFAHQKIDQQATLIRTGQASPAEKATAQALVNDFAQQLQYLKTAHPEQLDLRTTLTENMDALKSALNPPKAVSQAAHADDTVTRFKDELTQMQAAADAFGKDDSIDVKMAAFIDRINQAETAIRRLKGTNTAPQLAALDAVKAQVPALGDEYKAHVQTQFNATLDARITGLDGEIEAQRQLAAARLQGQDAVDQLTVKLAGMKAVQDAMNQAAQQGQPILLAQIKALREGAEVFAQNGIDAQKPNPILQPLTNISQEAERTRLQLQIQNAGRVLGGQQPIDMTPWLKDYQNAAVGAANAASDAVTKSNLPYVTQVKLLQQINALLKGIGDDGKPAADTLATVGADIAQAFRGAGDVANIMKNRQAGNLLNTAGNIAQNTTAALGSGFGNIGADVGAITSVVSFVTQLFGTSALAQEWKSVMTQNNQALANLTLKLAGFEVTPANTQAAAQGISAFEANPAATAALQSWSSAGGTSLVNGQSLQHGGDLQQQINALGPYLQQIFGAGTNIITDWQQLDAIAKQYGITLTDSQGRIIPAALNTLTTSLLDAAAAASKLTDTFSAQQQTNDLGNAIFGRNTPQASVTAAWDAYVTSHPNGGEPNVNPATLAGMNAIIAYFKMIYGQIQAGTLTPAEMGTDTSLSAFENSIWSVITPLNQLTNTANGVTAALTNVPTGYKVAYDRWLSTSGVDLTPSLASKTTALLTSVQTGTSAAPGQPLAGMLVQGDVNLNITSTATNADALFKDVQQTLKRGGTSPASYVIKQAAK